jgi:hypothetical protein
MGYRVSHTVDFRCYGMKNLHLFAPLPIALAQRTKPIGLNTYGMRAQRKPMKLKRLRGELLRR